MGIAQEQRRSRQCGNFEAWSHAVEATKRSRVNYPVENLLPLLEAYGAFSCSSSGVEQNFSVRQWLVPKQRGVSNQHELDHLQIVVADVSDEQAVFKAASVIWVQLYGKPRQTGFLGCECGIEGLEFEEICQTARMYFLEVS